MKSLLFLVAVLPCLLSGCAATEVLSRHLPPDAAESIHIYSRNEERSINLIDRALATCLDSTERAETACVKEALARASLGARELASLIPGCSVGSVCTYDHTTRRRLGLIPIYATIIEKDWRVSIDLRRDLAVADLLPVAVTDRNVFVVPPRITPKPAPTTLVAR